MTDPFLSGPVLCAICNHRWVAVRPADTTGLECPECHAAAGFDPGEDDEQEAGT